MAAETLIDLTAGPTPTQLRVLEDARRRLAELAQDLRPETADEAALLATAAALETVVHRIRWIVDLSRHEEER